MDGQTDTLTITLNGPIQDPIFYIWDIDAPGATLTVSPGDTTFVCDLDCVWNGNTATTTVGAPGPQGTSGSPAVEYAGLYGAGSQFTFVFDYTGVSPIDGELVGIGIGTMIPEPSTALLLGFALAGLAASRRRRAV